MITVDGREYGTADEIAAELGDDVTPDMVRRYAQRDGLERRVMPGRGRGTVVYPLDEASAIERAKRLSGRGRPRQLDTAIAPT